MSVSQSSRTRHRLKGHRRGCAGLNFDAMLKRLGWRAEPVARRMIKL